MQDNPTMKLKYYKTFKEDVGYKTWTYVDYTENDLMWNGDSTDGYGWVKNPYPSYLDTSDEAKKWYAISNEEDKHFVKMELKACRIWCEQEIARVKNWCEKEMNDIRIVENYNT